MMLAGSRRCVSQLQRRSMRLARGERFKSSAEATSNNASKVAKPSEPAASGPASASSSSANAGAAQLKSTQDMLKKASPILLGIAGGILIGRQSVPEHNHGHGHHDHHHKDHVIPNGMPRTCCDAPDITENQKALFKTLKRIVGKKNLIDGRVDTTETLPYLKGARLGRGSALYIVKPTKLKQIIEIVQESIDAGCVVLVQGQNTGLTGGSVPRKHDDERPTVLISMRDLDTIFPIDDGKRVVCLAGAGLASLQNFIQGYFPDRESHSILGSTFLNPTTAAGVALGSGGTQCRKGPAFTDRALYLKVTQDKFGKSVVKVVNTLGVDGFDSEEGEFDAHLEHSGVVPKLDAYVGFVKNNSKPDSKMRKSNDTYGKEAASDVEYKDRLCKNDSGISRFNADTSGCECNRSEGKVLILASVHDTFEKPTTAKTFWISFDSLETALNYRREVCLKTPQDLPVSMEYLDRDSFEVIDQSGRILGNVIKAVGPSSAVVRNLWNVKLWIESLPISGASVFADKMLYLFNPVFPKLLPNPVVKMSQKYGHHVAITVGDYDGSLDRFMERMDAFRKQEGDKVSVYECASKSQEASFTAFRFIAAPAFRTWCVGTGNQGFSVDYALPKNGGAVPDLESSADAPLKRMRYSHFACNVVHEDLAFAPGVDVHKQKMVLKNNVEHSCGGKLPAEHGHGTEYHAPKETKERWQNMDPLNVMNPGVGGLSSKYKYAE